MKITQRVPGQLGLKRQLGEYFRQASSSESLSAAREVLSDSTNDQVREVLLPL